MGWEDKMKKIKSYKRGTIVRVVEDSGHVTVGHFWMNEKAKRRIVLIGTFPPIRLGNLHIERRYCHYENILEIQKLDVNNMEAKK